MLKGVHARSLEPEKIGALIHFIKEDLGFHLHRAVQKVKCDLSNDAAATFQFSDGMWICGRQWNEHPLRSGSLRNLDRSLDASILSSVLPVFDPRILIWSSSRVALHSFQPSGEFLKHDLERSDFAAETSLRR
jgi:hypothetical protein